MAEIVDVDAFEQTIDVDNVTDRYREFRDAEGIPVHTGLYIDDWNALETGRWDRTGQRGAFVNLYGAEGVNDMHLHELEPGGKTTTQRHLYEEIVYVADGEGLTVVGEGENEIVFEWSEHALFFLPPNTPYRHVNASGDEPARLLAETPLPQLLTMYRDESILFEPGPSRWAQYQEEGYYDADAGILEAKDPDKPGGVLKWMANFVPDIQRFEKLEAHQARGAGGTSVIFPFEDTSMWAHISEFPVGTYKKAHRHHPGANVGILSGEGFSLMWVEGWDERVRIDWSARSMFTPPASWYHQHFNTSDRKDRYFAMHGPKLGTLEEANIFDYTNPANQIEYVDEDPEIRELYEAELDRTGIDSRMPDEAYADPDFAFGAGD
ncbi:MAG: cupin domain-containing protein [Haloferacaceae archaeon]